MFIIVDKTMTPFHIPFFSWLIAGLILAVFLIYFGAKRFRLLGQALCFISAVLFVWLSLIIGTHMGYGAWQSISDPPDEAFADGAKLMASVFAGWLPSGIFCLIVLLIARLIAQPRAIVQK